MKSCHITYNQHNITMFVGGISWGRSHKLALIPAGFLCLGLTLALDDFARITPVCFEDAHETSSWNDGLLLRLACLFWETKELKASLLLGISEVYTIKAKNESLRICVISLTIPSFSAVSKQIMMPQDGWFRGLPTYPSGQLFGE